MSVIIGSARIDEKGTAHGGNAGDQKQGSTPDYKGEVSMQNFYVHSKGWYIFRAKSDDHANKLAKCMKRACNNSCIGYDQNQRDGIIKNHTDTKVKTECDCSSLVRECIIEATGKDPGNMTTSTMPDILPKTGLFKDMKSYTSRTTLYTGDILVTKTTGHTVIVVEGKERSTKQDKDSDSPKPKKTTSEIAKPTLRLGSSGYQVKVLQKNINEMGIRKLIIDGEFGINTKLAVIAFQKKNDLTQDGIYGPKTYAKLKSEFN